jgi:2-dehydro-3-deoxy-D-arabinonate dehydratase
MKLYKLKKGAALEDDNGKIYKMSVKDWDKFINRDDLYEFLSKNKNSDNLKSAKWLSQKTLLPPIGNQEIWAAGVTYLRSRDARMEESAASGGATFYDKVYEAERPELFFKGTAVRAVGNDGLVQIRKDSTWDVPEPELTLFVTKNGKIVAYTVGNDMSSRSIEGENPLYLPQAKVYDRCAGLGPCLYIPKEPLPRETSIQMTINRNGQSVFEGNTTVSQMKRTPTELVGYLVRECTFPNGVFLMTGTCIVPDPPFTLQSGDEILMTIEGIGTLRNVVA